MCGDCRHSYVPGRYSWVTLQCQHPCKCCFKGHQMWAFRSWLRVWWVKFAAKTELEKRQDRYICSLMTFFRQRISI